MLAEDTAALDQAFILDDRERLDRHRRGQSVAAEGRAMRARLEYVHHRAPREEGRDRHHAPAQRLAQDDAVRKDAFVLEGEPSAGASEPGLDLIDDQQHVMEIAEAAK